MNAKDREQANLTTDEIDILQFILDDFTEKIKSTFQNGTSWHDEKVTLYTMLVIDKKLRLLKRIAA